MVNGELLCWPELRRTPQCALAFVVLRCVALLALFVGLVVRAFRFVGWGIDGLGLVVRARTAVLSAAATAKRPTNPHTRWRLMCT